MLVGPAGSQEFCAQKGSTIHHRKVQVLRLCIDFHCRIASQTLSSPALGNMAPSTFDDFCAVALRKGTGQNVGCTTRLSMYFTFPEDLSLFTALLETDLGQSLRMMMSKFFDLLLGA